MTDTTLPFYRSLRFRLSLVLAAIILLSVMITAGFAARQGFERDIDNKRDLLAGAASAYAAAIADPVFDRRLGDTYAAMRGVRSLPGVVQTDVRLSRGDIFAQIGSSAALVRESGDPMSMTHAEIWAARHLRVEMPILKDGEQIAVLHILADISDIQSAIFAGLRNTATTALFSALLGVCLAQWIIGRLTRPLQQLSVMMAIFGDDQAANVPEIHSGRDETGILASAFNAMIASIRSRDAQIATHMETLEMTIDERTHDLRVARDAAQAANAAKSDFLATMSHEIRTPMNGMLVMAEMLSVANLPKKHRRYADIIARSGQSLLTIINDVLDLSKIESGKMDLEAVPVCPDHLIGDVAGLFSAQASKKGLQLATYVSPSVPESIIADPTRLGQILTNLVNNALKFTERGGVKLSLDAKPGKDAGTTRLILCVEDSGIGIRSEKLDLIFEAFSQADQTTTRRFGGTGLGLSVCKRLVEAMGGAISATSNVGIGSAFRAEIEFLIDKPAPSIARQDLKVGLLMENGVSKDTFVQTFEDFGCHITLQNPDVYIGSSQMIRARDATSIPCIIINTIGDVHADELLTSGRAKDVVTLPASRSELGALVQRAKRKTFLGANAVSAREDVTVYRAFENMTVLAADDNAVNREVLREALATLKVKVDFAEDGAEAVRLASEGQYEAIFMDGSMPVMDGFAATHAIRANEARLSKRRVPIIALTAQIVGVTADAWRAAGADHYMTKPFSLDRLASTLSQLNSTSQAWTDNSPAQNEETLLAEDTLANLHALGARSGRDVRGRIWDMFRSRFPDGVSHMADLMACDSPDEAISRQAHALKSMALSAGAAQLVKLLETIEAAPRNASVRDKRDVRLQALTACMQSTFLAMEKIERAPVAQV